jgi:hypothetical protein
MRLRRGGLALEAAAGFEDHEGGRQIFDPAEVLVEPFFIVGHGEGSSRRQEGHIQAGFGDIDADVGSSWRNIQPLAPFALPAPNLAGTGSEQRELLAQAKAHGREHHRGGRRQVLPASGRSKRPGSGPQEAAHFLNYLPPLEYANSKETSGNHRLWISYRSREKRVPKDPSPSSKTRSRSVRRAAPPVPGC